MRLLLSAYACRPNAGSEPGYGWNWAAHLGARGIEVHALVAHRNRQAVESGGPLQNVRFHFVEVPSWTKRSESLHYACWQFAALIHARRLHHECKFDIAHHVTYGSLHVPTQLWRLGIPVVFGPVGGGQTAPASMLEYFGPDKSREQRRTWVTNKIRLSPYHRRSLRGVSAVLAANSDTMRLVQSLGCTDPILMCDAGLPSNYFAPTPRKFEDRNQACRLLWVGRFLQRKALPLALDALKEVRSNVTMTIAGDGMDPQGVREMIRERDLERRVFWKGERLPWNELRTAYAEHDAMLFTSLRDSFGSQLLEAMAMGLPVITLDLHGAHDFVPEQASLKIPVTNPQATVRELARAIELYASFRAEKRNEMSRCAWRFAKGLSWSARAEFAENLYDRVLSRTKTSSASSVLPALTSI